MSVPSGDPRWDALGADPGQCRLCRHALLNVTRRGTGYLRCGRAAWDDALPRHPRLPVTDCPGFESGSGTTATGGRS
ncbi:MAG: hypothetical protein ACR2JQ_10325 [Mycobacteriales bacterium]